VNQLAGVTRETLIEALGKLELDWGDEEDAVELVALLLQTYKPEGVYTWLFFHNNRLGATPLYLLEMGRAREVFIEARRLTAMEAT
jgi:hypothetical protein